MTLLSPSPPEPPPGPVAARVVVVTYNPGATLDSFLASLKTATPLPIEVVMVDNGSTDGAPRAAAEAGGRRLIETGRNLGYGAADNVVSGRSHDRQRATLTSATGQLHGRLRAVSRVRCHRSSTRSTAARRDSASKYGFLHTGGRRVTHVVVVTRAISRSSCTAEAPPPTTTTCCPVKSSACR